ncbi:hypothetical protein BDAP_000448 [Binucleata daphniae]
MAPEIIQKELYDEKVDIWSLGVCMYEMVEHKRPFNGKTRKELQKNIIETEVPKMNMIDNSGLLYEIIKQCLIKNKEERMGILELRRMDRIKYCNALNEIKQKERKIVMLENRIKEIEMSYLQTPKELSMKKND